MGTTLPGRPAVDVRRAQERCHTKIPRLDPHHRFSFSTHHDPANTDHGLLVVSNDDPHIQDRTPVNGHGACGHDHPGRVVSRASV